MRHTLLIVCGLLIAALGALPAQDQSPTKPPPSDLVSASRAALEELADLNARAAADREAFQANEADLDRAIQDAQKPLPELPPPLDQFGRYDREYIRSQLTIADKFLRAWTYRQAHRTRAAETLAQLESLSATLPATHERLLERVTALRPVLIEAQRRIDRRDVKAAELEGKEGSGSVAEWIAKSEDLLKHRETLVGEVDEMVARLARLRGEFDALPADDPELARFARRVEISLTTIAEATAVSEEQRRRLEAAPRETVPSEVEQVIEEWKSRRDALLAAAEGIEEKKERLAEVTTELAALAVPSRDDIPIGDGLREIREAKQTVELAKRMIAYHESRLRLFEAADARRRDLLGVLRAVSSGHADFTRQSARAVSSLRYVTEGAQGAPPADWKAPETAESVWIEWTRRQVEELARRELAARVERALVGEDGLKSVQTQLAEERQNLKRAEADLETERLYAESVDRMRDRTDEQLLALLAPGGEIARLLARLEADISTLQAQIDATTTRVLKAVRAIQAVENPYTQTVLRESSGALAEIRGKLAKLPKGEVLPAESTENLDNWVKRLSRESFLDELKKTEADGEGAEALAKKEGELLAREQQFARVFLEFFQAIEDSFAELRAAGLERSRLDTELEARLDEEIREEKRRYAAARELRRRVEDGRLDAAKEPPEVAQWLDRDPIQKASTELRNARRDSTRSRERLAYETARVETLGPGSSWMQARSDAADDRMPLIGDLVTVLTRAMTPLAGLSDVDRGELQYDASVLEAEHDPALAGLLERFTDPAHRQRFEDPLGTWYLELANTRRVRDELQEVAAKYVQLSEVCATERERLAPLKAQVQETVAHRTFDYHAARHAAAVAVHPETRARIEELFRSTYGRDLPYRFNFAESDVDLAAELVFGAQARLIAELALGRDADRHLSKLGLDQESAWYRSQAARIGSLGEVWTSRETKLDERIDGLRKEYYDLLESNALTGVGVTLFIPFAALLLVRVLRRGARGFEARVVRKQGEDMSDRQRRLQTVSKTTTAAISVLVWTIAILYMFARLGLDVTPIVASASVVGLAVAFGAQALIKDFFSGFFILIENQFTIGDVVTLGNITGTVENISLRITVLRDLKGIVHYIPNGSIGQVSNQTQGWSRVVMEISVAYKEDPDHAAGVLGEALLEMARDPQWRSDIIEDPVVAGVENLTERAVDMRVMIKTRPGKQWGVAREARRRIKKRFDALGIEIPFPHRVVHHVYEGVETPARRSEATGAPEAPAGERSGPGLS